MDLVYVGITFVFFALAVAYVAGCDRLAGPAQAPDSQSGGAS